MAAACALPQRLLVGWMLMLLVSPAASLLVGSSASRRPTRGAAMMAKNAKAAADASADPAIAAAASSLLAETKKAERDLRAIDALVATLEAAEVPPKPKRLLTGTDWELAFASDAEAVAPFVSGEASGPFTFTEAVFFRLRKGDQFAAIEVTRRVGPFGNSKTSLNGGWSLPKRDAATLRWKASWGLDDRGREVTPPSGATAAHEATLTHASSSLLIMRGLAADPKSFVVFSSVAKLDKALEELNVGPED